MSPGSASLLYPPPHHVKSRREAAGFSLSALASLMGVDRSLISKVENEQVPMSEDFRDRFWAVFGENGTARHVVEVARELCDLVQTLDGGSRPTARLRSRSRRDRA